MKTNKCYSDVKIIPPIIMRTNLLTRLTEMEAQDMHDCHFSVFVKIVLILAAASVSIIFALVEISKLNPAAGRPPSDQ